MLSRLRSLARAALGRERLEDEMDAELRFHLEENVEDLVRRGVPRDEAERQARGAFGRVESVKDACREARGVDAIDSLRRDVRHACRLLARSPGFAFTAIGTLALCIGVNSAIFSVVDAVLFRPLPYPAPDRLAQVVTHLEAGPEGGGPLLMTAQTGTTWELLRERARALDWATFSDISTSLNLVAGRNVRYVAQQRVSSGFFRVLGTGPAIGREFTAEEDRPGGPRAVILSHALWVTLFGGAWPATGAVLLRGEPYSVVGVMPADFTTSVPADVWTPLQPSRTGEGAGENYTVIGRLKPGVNWAAASASIAGVGQAVAADLRGSGVRARVEIVPLQRAATDPVRRPLLILMAAVGVVLLIGCLNLAALLVARGLDRSPEIATRIAMGCGRSGVVRQLVVENLVLAAAGCLAALLVAKIAVGWLASVAADTYGLCQPIGLDGRVLVMTTLSAIAASLLFGVAPALQALRLDVRAGLAAGGGRAVARAATRWPRRLLVVTQISLGVLLVADASLLVRSFRHLTNAAPGIDTTNVLAASLPLQDVRYTTSSSINRLFDRTLAGIKALPGVECAAVSLSLPYERGLNMPVLVSASPRNVMTVLSYVTPDYFAALRIPLRRGRRFHDSDTATAARVAVVNEAFAKAHLRGREPLGGQVKMLGGAWSIIGVAGNVRQKASLSGYEPVDALPVVYIPAAQVPDGLTRVHVWFSPSWIVRTTGPQPGLARSLQGVVEAVDPQIQFASFTRIDEVKQRTLAPERFQATLLAAFSALAVLLAALGLYGLVAKSVAERTRELGIRMALGSTAAQAMRTVAVPIVALAVVGISAGALLAAWSARVLENQVWGVSARDPYSLATAGGLLLAITIVVSFGATLRVAHLNPAETLRRE